MYRAGLHCVLLMFINVLPLFPGFVSANESQVFIEGGVEYINFDYREFDTSGSLLDKELGDIPGLNFNIIKDDGVNVYGVMTAYQSGEISYDGMTQSGAPHTTDTEERISNIKVFIKRNMPAIHEGLDILFALGYRRWERDIRSTASVNGLYEVYKWPYWQLGAEIDLTKINEYNISLLGYAGRAFNPMLDVHFPGYDNTVIHQPNGRNFYLAVPIHIDSNRDYRFVIQPYYEYWYFARSESRNLLQNGIPSGYAITEPENETELVGIKFSVKFSL